MKEKANLNLTFSFIEQRYLSSFFEEVIGNKIKKKNKNNYKNKNENIKNTSIT